jgi:L-threonylcarbamoyladenylate synthase
MRGKYVTETVEANDAGMARAAATLRDGGLVAVPTETVYGLAARADSEEAVARIYAAKGRPGFNPLIVHLASPQAAERHADFNRTAQRLAQAWWPGPLTMVLPRKPGAGLAPAVSAGLPTVALRVPAHRVMRGLLALCDFPLAAPSANRSGFISPTRAEHVLASLDGRIDLVLDAGPSQAGLESTIVAVRADGSWQELRPGPIGLADLAAAAGEGDRGEAGGGIEAPGQLASHYAPGKPVRLGCETAAADEYLIGFGAVAGDISLSETGDLGEAAARLYACLHAAARSGKPRIAVAPVPARGIGLAINDRLRRAAA